VVQEVVISGTATLRFGQPSEISNKLVSMTMADDDEIAGDYIKYEFQPRGYFDAEIANLKMVPVDPLAKEKPVPLEASVDEGPRFHLAEIRFTGEPGF
jgi:hypothetical protein